jgi:hypothetical protein
MRSSYFGNGRNQFVRQSVLLYHKKNIEANYEFLKCHLENNVLVCTGTITNPDYKNIYQVEIRCVEGYEPKTVIKEPMDIEPSLNIHMYSDHSLCLHYPKDMKWTGRTPIYKYTIPWLAEWVHFYEIYLVNGGKWIGRESPAHFTSADMNLGEDK